MPAVPGHGGQVGTRACPHRPLGGRDDPDRAPTTGALPRLCATHILLPTALQVRRADTTEVIGNALAYKANGLGFRSIAERMGRPESTVRRWLRRAAGEHVQWLHRRGTERLFLVAREAFGNIRFVGNPLGDALCVLAAAAVEDRRRFGFPDPPWDLIGIYTQGRLLSPPRSG
ncbi:sigma-70 region 4 domain-containing protein [Rhodococcus pyridinivorans]|uniref:helix-turn-helix domain-containing protein n=1 Tax=Rhodococcus pyridinivorans TaxID=103816 RepID=UPI001E2904D4|nr:sigma-70 region 4 domain-containing protein [Rhodococcus pyridinivorans]MCD5422858.1 sigma-70 region 4 domain-containing protein [Rhodococcus pyridinivorans]